MTDPGAAVRTQALTKRFGSLVAVNRLDLEVREGEIMGFLGPNGAGKSTTIRMMCGLLQPTSGTAHVAGYDVVAEAVEVKRRVGYLAENPYLYDKLTAREFLRFVADLHTVDPTTAGDRSETLLRALGLAKRADDLVESYSRGMRQKLGLIAALLHNPKVLALDEPTSGLDPRSARAVKDILLGLAARGRAILLSTHVLEVAQHMCHRVAIIDRGRLRATGSMDELRERAEDQDASLEDIFLKVTGGAAVSEMAASLEG